MQKSDFVEGVKTVTLNGQYSAKVYSDKVVVGCQTFEAEAIDKLFEAWGNRG